MGGHIADDRRLYRTHIRDYCARGKMRADLLCDRTTSADRDADNDQIGAFHRDRIVFDHLIGKTELGNTPTGLQRARGHYNCACCILRTHRARNRRADKPDTDQGQAIE
jgi:hypothetical protein